MEQMNITSAQYVVSISGKVSCINCTIDGQEWSVPLDPNNRRYAEILRQGEAVELTIEPAESE